MMHHGASLPLLLLVLVQAVTAVAAVSAAAVEAPAADVAEIIAAADVVDAFATEPAPAGTIATLQPASRRESMRAQMLSRAGRLYVASMDPLPAAQAEVKAQVVCGANSLVSTNLIPHCRITVFWGNGVTTSCSAAKIGANRLATAGHCVYSKDRGYARSVDVYCTGQKTCPGKSVPRTTTSTQIITTARWLASSTTVSTAWDAAVIRTNATLPGTAFPLAEYTSSGTRSVRVTGYPGQNPAAAGCNNAAYNVCTQFSSTDSLTTSQTGMYASNRLDICAGHSGSGVIDTTSNALVALLTGEQMLAGGGASQGACINNLFVPNVVASGRFDASTCERSSGGVSLACLSAKLPA